MLRNALTADARDAEELLRLAGETSIDLDALTAELKHEGVRAFCDSYHQLLACIQPKLDPARHITGARSSTGVMVETTQRTRCSQGAFNVQSTVTVFARRAALTWLCSFE